MAGSLPSQKILRHGKSSRFLHRPGVADSQGWQGLHDLIRKRTVGIRKPPHRISHRGLQASAILQNLLNHLLHGASGNCRMGAGMAGYLMPPVQLPIFRNGNSCFCRNPRIYMKSPPDAVAVKHIHQLSVLHTAVVKAHGQYLMLSLRKTDINIPHITPLRASEARLQIQLCRFSLLPDHFMQSPFILAAFIPYRPFAVTFSRQIFSRGISSSPTR